MLKRSDAYLVEVLGVDDSAELCWSPENVMTGYTCVVNIVNFFDASGMSYPCQIGIQ
jgi:hypothetical protein